MSITVYGQRTTINLTGGRHLPDGRRRAKYRIGGDFCMSFKHAAGLVFLVLCLSPFLEAAPTGAIRGTILDQTGAAVPDAAIVLTNLGTNESRKVTSGTSGDFTLPMIPVGQYTIRVEKTGFRSYVQTPVTITINAQVTLTVQLEVGSTHQQVTVTGQAPLVNTESAQVRDLVDREQIQNLPLNGRNTLQLTLLAGGVANTGGGYSDQGFTDQDALVFPGASGGRADSINYIFDGGINNDRYTNVALPIPNPDAVQEFSFLTNSFSAEYGAASGGVVNIVTKSGTNALHGSAFNYLRNYALNATNFFTPGQSDNLKRNQPGFTLGGPVYLPDIYNGRNKSFFFVSWEDTFLRQAPVSAAGTALTADERNGDFSAIAQKLGTSVIDPSTGQPFPGNIIPTSRFDPVMVKEIALLPVGAPVTGLVTYRGTQNNIDTPQWLARVDQKISSADQMTLRYFYDYYNPNPIVNPQNPYFTGTDIIKQRSQNFILSDTHIFSNRLLGDFNFTFSRLGNVETYDYPGPANNDPSALGIQGFPNGSFFLRSPFVAVGYVGPYTKLSSNNFQYKASFSYVTGRHEFKWGVDYIRAQLNQQRLALGGNWFFGSTFTGISDADFLLGLPDSFSATGTFGEALRQNEFGAYFQDDFRVSRHLTINLGIRYDPYFPWSEITDDKATFFRPGQKSTRFPLLPVGAVVAGDPGVTGYTSRLNNFAPRVGFAFDPTGSGKTAIRAAAGIFYSQPVSASINQRAQVNFPFITTASLSPGQLGALGPGAVENVFRTGTPNQIFNPYSITTGVPPSNFPVPTPLLYVSTAADFPTPNAIQWNFSIEHQLGREWTITTTYMGSKSTHIEMLHERNPYNYIPGVGPNGEPLSTFANEDDRRPYGPTFTSIQELGDDGNANYNALVLGLRKVWGGDHWWSRSTVSANYTWSHTLDVLSSANSPGGSTPLDPFDEELDYGNADYDHRNSFVLSYVWGLPKLSLSPRWVRAVAGSWNTASIVTLQDGSPFSVFSGYDKSQSGITSRADQVSANPYLSSSRSQGQQILQWFNTQAFAIAAAGTYGTSGRNILRGPGLTDVDFSLYKDFTLGRSESRYLEARWDFFNFLNDVNLGLPNSTVFSTTFGRITSAGSPRISQVSLRIVF